MCETTTAQRILETVQLLPESAAREVLTFAQSLGQKRTNKTERLSDLMDSLPDLPTFKGDPVKIQQALRDEWR